MGQKVSPIGMRVGVIRDWESRWYADKADYANLLNEDVKIRKFLEKTLKDAYVSRIEIERTSKKDCHIIVRCARPGAAVGKDADGKDKADALKRQLVKLTGGKAVKIDFVQVANPDLDAHLVARKICEQLEARQSFRIAQKKAIQQTMRSGAKGIKTLATGRLGGAEIARKEGYSQGVVPLHTLRSDIDYACEEAHTTYGKLGVKVWICRGEVLPGKMVEEPKAPERPARDGRRNGRGRNDRRFSGRRPANGTAPAAKPADAGKAAAPEAAQGGKN
ncbi:30S ribosomal protein S3 [Erysipelotrichaceae bacterium Oil+RF-744-GAM-WT-6]|uniref:Small ribosomal subunit protein uS3 n=1 Tax=Stecheria intestinalis TaxID=2606630 RepID=A0A7X2TFT7_9FIRM|nr:30S ribosomal protein S3 [Stecheria intestinalis]MSS58490.1 30S ribosomal protein S3 [Stecheria intestinalis]